MWFLCSKWRNSFQKSCCHPWTQVSFTLRFIGRYCNPRTPFKCLLFPTKSIVSLYFLLKIWNTHDASSTQLLLDHTRVGINRSNMNDNLQALVVKHVSDNQIVSLVLSSIYIYSLFQAFRSIYTQAICKYKCKHLLTDVVYTLQTRQTCWFNIAIYATLLASLELCWVMLADVGSVLTNM